MSCAFSFHDNARFCPLIIVGRIERYMENKQYIVDKIEAAQSCCIDLATGKGSYEEYEEARSALISEPLMHSHIPEWLISCRYGGQFWSLMKKTSSSYQGRRDFIWNEFGPLLDFVEKQGIEPTSLSIEDALSRCSSKSVGEAWLRCFQRRADDPEGAITSARTMLESVCKYILDDQGEQYNPKEDLPKLYKRTAKLLNLSPGQHNAQIFKQILSGCGSVVDGLASLRNAFGDAHGKGLRHVKASKRHAELAVNLSGTICSFLISTHKAKNAANKRLHK